MALPPKGAWKYLLGVGFRSLTAYPAAWPVISILVLIKIALLLVISELFKEPTRLQYEKFAILTIAAPISFLLYTYWFYGLLFGFVSIKWRHFLLSLWRNFLAVLVIMACALLSMVPALLVGATMGVASKFLRESGASEAMLMAVPITVLVVMTCITFYIIIRLVFMSAIAMVDGRISVMRSWRLSTGWMKTLSACWFVLWLLSVIAGVVFALAEFVIGEKGALVGINIVTSLATMVSTAIIVKAYKKAAQEEAAVSPTAESF